MDTTQPAVVGLCASLRPHLAAAFDLSEQDVEAVLRHDAILGKLKQFAQAVPDVSAPEPHHTPLGRKGGRRVGGGAAAGARSPSRVGTSARKSLEGNGGDQSPHRRATRQSQYQNSPVRVRSSASSLGKRRLPLLFYSDEAERPASNSAEARGGLADTITCSLGDVVPVEGIVVYVLRSSPATTPLPAEVRGDIVIGQLAAGANLLSDLQMVMASVYVPALEQDDKSAITASALARFSASLLDTADHVRAQVILETTPKNSVMAAAEGEPDEAALLRAAANPRILVVYEDLVEQWCVQVDGVLSAGGDEALNTTNPRYTPFSELRHWNRRMVRLTSLEQQLSSRESLSVLTILKLANSTRLPLWRTLYARLVEAGHEARDNVKYLSSIEASFGPLASSDPQTLVDAIPGVIRCVGWLSSLARYYNTPERLTVLLLRVANQLVLSLRAHIGSAPANLEGTLIESDAAKKGGGGAGPTSLWDLRADAVLARMDAAAWVHQAFHSEYDRAKEEMADLGTERQFQFNEATIFSRFDAFAQRVGDVRAMLTTISQFSALEEAPLDQHSLEPMMDRLRLLLVQLRRQGRHPLKIPDGEFNELQALFQHSCAEMDKLIHSSLATSLNHISSTERALRVMTDLSKLPVLKRPALQDEVHLFYERLFEHYSQDLDKAKLLYETLKDNPPCPRNMPPVAGAVAWARQLYRCIQRPMALFEAQNEQLGIMHTSVARHTIRLYNRIAGTLVAFETGFVEKWCEAVVHAKAGLAATLLIRHPTSGELFVNFDPQIQRFAQEAVALRHLDVELPAEARFLVANIAVYRSHYDNIDFVIKERARLMEKVDALYRGMLGPHLEDIDVLLEPGLSVLTWSSLSVPGYIASVREALRRVEDVVDKANDILSRQIEAGLKWLAATDLVSIPSDRLMSLDEFVENAELHVAHLAPRLESKSAALETAAQELVALITASYSEQQREECAPAGDQLIELIERRTLRALQECILTALRTLRRRLSSGMSRGFIFLEQPLFQVDVQLKIPTVVVSPSLDEVQTGVVKMSKCILSTAKHVMRWGPARVAQKPMFEFVGRSRAIIKVVFQLTGTFHGLRTRVEAWVSTFVTKYDFLWRNDVETLVDEFAEGNPTLDDFENSISKLQTLLGEIEDIPPSQAFESLALQTSVLKKSLSAEAMRWKHEYGKALSTWAQTELAELVRFIGETEKQLSVDTSDLDGVARVMTSLSELRDMESEIDLKIAPILDAQAVLNRYQVQVPAEHSQSLDEVLLQWRRLKELAQEVAAHLQTVQPQLKEALLRQMTQFSDDTEQLKADWTAQGPITPGITTSTSMTRLAVFKTRFDEIERKRSTFETAAVLFGLPRQRHPALDKIRREIRLLSNLLSLFSNVTSTVATYRATLWIDLDFDKVHAQLTQFQLQSSRLPKATKHWDAYRELTHVITEFSNVVPLLSSLSQRFIVDRHWRWLEKLTGHHFSRDLDHFTLAHALEAPLVNHQEEIEDMCACAMKEAEVETSLGRIKDDWIFQNFEFADYHGRGPLSLNPRHTAELVTRLDDSQVLLGALLSSRYNEPFKRELLEWLRKLTNVHEAVERWLEVQALWMYLEAVFSGGDIARQLPLEAKRFHSIDASWSKLMVHSSNQANVLSVCDPEGALASTLPFLTEQMEVCQKSLAGYLEAKRNLFPRFNFVSDPVLLEILGQGSDPVAIQPHLGSLFSNVVATSSPKNEPLRLFAMHSAEGEGVSFSEPVMAEGHVEDWLERLEAEMQRTIHDIMKELSSALFTVDEGRLDWVPEYPAQCCLLGLKLLWTHDVARALQDKDRAAVNTVWRKTTNLLNQLVAAASSPDLSSVDRKKQEALITVQVHNRDVLTTLAGMRVRSTNDFEWGKQMRAYYDPGNNHAFYYSIADVQLDYRYEYIGCQDRLVITPLTDRCYITLAQAIAMHLGGSPIGPAGTGKTETVKDMGHALGQFVVVFNCSDSMSSSGLGRVFRGLAQAGVWGDFDEFNRISVPVLSVAAQQIGCVFNALRDYALQSAFTPNMKKYEFKFTDGNQCRLKVGVGIFVTMNPGYAGRQELPENLKSLFRMVSMMVPDRDIIARVRLAASGFLENELLSAKLDSLYSLCQQQLSRQVHYDFGLRSILSVLRALAPARKALAAEQTAALEAQAERAQRQGQGDGSLGQIPRAVNAVAETTLFLKVVKDMNLPKLIAEDEARFLQLLKDLFPGGGETAAEAADLLPAELRAVCDRMGVAAPEEWLSKVCCIWEVSCVRWGLMILGPSRSSKSTALKVVRAAKNIHEAHMNPKALSVDSLFGRLHPATQDWTDGCLSQQWRRAAGLESRKGEASWLVLDGPVDADWIENLNTVLDDNRMLSLANGDRLKMPSKLRLVFEVGSLDNASPATISRCGMVYMDAATLSWRQVVEAWSWKCVDDEWASREEMAAVLQLSFSFLPEALHFVAQHHALVVSRSAASSLVHTLLVLLRSTRFPGSDLPSDGDDHRSSLELLRRTFTFCLAWSFGVVFSEPGRRQFNEWLRTYQPPPLPAGATLLSRPEYYAGMVFEDAQPDPLLQAEEPGFYVFDMQLDEFGSWVPWMADASPKPDLSSAALSRISVPTVETERINYLASLLEKTLTPVLLMSEAGAGKTWLSESFTATQSRTAVLCRTIGLCTDTQPEDLQQSLFAMLDKRIGNSYGASGQRRLRLFVDDVNLPRYNKWGDQPTNEALRQLVERDGFYSLTKLGEWQHLDDMYVVAAMRQPGGLEQDVPARVKGRFCTFVLSPPSAELIDHIYGFVTASYFHRFSHPVQELANLLPGLTATLYASVKEALRPSPAAFHYQWTLSHVGRVFEGLLRCNAFAGPAALLSLWRHEVDRVFADQLLDCAGGRADWTWLQDYATALVGDRFPSVHLAPVFYTTVPSGAVLPEPTRRRAAAGASGNGSGGSDNDDDGRDEDDDGDEEEDPNAVAPYRPVSDLTKLQPYLTHAVVRHNGRRHAAHLDMVVFKEVAVHVARLVRILRNPTGNALLIGVGGSGKRSIVHLCSTLTDFTLRMPRTNKLGFFMEDLKDMVVMAGLQGQRVCMLLADADAKNEAVLSTLSHVMAGRDIPGLFVKEELETLLLDLRAAAEQVLDSFDIGHDDLERFFHDRLRRNLRVVLCASPTGTLLKQAVRTYPALLATCSIDWVHRWPQSALLEVARSHLGPSASASTSPTAADAGAGRRKASGRKTSRQSAAGVAAAGKRSPRRPPPSSSRSTTPRRPRRASRSASNASQTSQIAAEVMAEIEAEQQQQDAGAAAPATAEEAVVVDDRDESERAVAFMAEAHTVTEEACETCLKQTGKFRYVTPRVFLMLVEYYKTVHDSQRRRISARASAVEAGLSKLTQAELDIQRMGEELLGKEAELREAGLHLTALVEEIRTQTSFAERAKVEVLGVRERLASEAADLEQVVAEVQTELDRATPALEQALAALNSISSSDIITLKKLGKPPNLIRRIMDGVLLLCRERILPVQPDPEFDDGRLRPSWANARDMMSDPRFLERLVLFPKDEVNAETVELLEPYLNMPDFNFESALHSSGNVAGVCTWVQAMVTYFYVAREVAPKRLAVHEEQSRLDAKRTVLAQAQAELEEKQAALDESTAAYESAVAEKQRKEADLVLTRSTLERARSLVTELSGEQQRWRQQLGEFEATLVRLPGDALLAASFMSYAAPFSQEMRARMMASWKQSLQRCHIAFSPELDVVAFMVEDAAAMQWSLEGLPTDTHSAQNGLFTTLSVASGMRRGGRPPLLLDPQGQGREWLQRREAAAGISIVSAPSCARLAAKGAGQDLQARIIDHMISGRPLMVVDLGEELDPALDPLLERKHLTIKGRPHLVVGDREVPVEDGFRIYLATRVANPHFTPEVSANTTMVEFGVTPAALEEQLLGVVIANERSDLEVQRLQLQEEIAEFRGKSAQLAAELLQRLSSAQGNLLDDNELIEVLAHTKNTAMQVEAKVASAEAMRETLMLAYQEYTPVAKRGSIVYFVVSGLARLSHMYQISLPRFIQIFTGALRKAQRVASVQRRVGGLLQTTTYELLRHALSGLFEQHKQTLVLLVALSLQLADGSASQAEYDALVEDGASVPPAPVQQTAAFGWLSPESFKRMHRLQQTLPAFSGLRAVISEDAWRVWGASSAPETERVVPNLTPLQELLLVRALRPDRCMAAATHYIAAVLGERFTAVELLDLKDAVEVCEPDVPVLYLLSRGADPLATVADLAKAQKKHLSVVSMGQGQERLARQAVAAGMADGHWVLLQNAHLAMDLMEELPSLVDDEAAAPDFRLLLTVQPDDAFPLGLLQKSVRLTTEPPRGVRAGLRRHFVAFGQDDLDAIHSSAWRQLLFTLAFMHTCVVERRKYGPLGFSVAAYDFSSADLVASVTCARSLMEASGGDMDWVAARFLISEVLAGGCVTHENDREVMKAYGRQLLSQGVFMPEYQLHPSVVVQDFPVIDAYLKYVDQLPATDSADLFRLSPSADYVYELTNTASVFKAVRCMQRAAEASDQGELEARGKAVAAALAAELPAPFEEDDLAAALERLGLQLSMTLFLRDEALALAGVLREAHEAVQGILLAIDGSAIMSAQQHATLLSLVDNAVPERWALPGVGEQPLATWATAVQRRAEVLARWMRSGRPRRVALGDLFAPEAFLTALKQDVCHALASETKALDALHFSIAVVDPSASAATTDSASADSVLLIGLDIVGGAWDERRAVLVDARPRVASVSMPPLLLQVVPQKRVFDGRVFQCPVYRNSSRAGSSILTVPLISGEDSDFWLLRGTALVCAS